MALSLEQAWGPTPLVLTEQPKRMISLVPSVTETMLQWGGTLVGRSSFCIMPKSLVANIDRVGGTKTPNHKRIAALHPDLVIANLEENQKSDIQALQDSGIPVWITYPGDMPRTLTYLRQLRQLCPTGATQADRDLCTFEAFVNDTANQPANHTVTILIWKDPWMTVGKQTYTDDLLAAAGLQNAISQTRYPVLSDEQLFQLDMDVLLLPSEPYAFTSKHQRALQTRLKKVGHAAKVVLFNGEDLFWSGLRALDAVKDLQAIFLDAKGGAHDNACV